jgi:hypothetical protein
MKRKLRSKLQRRKMGKRAVKRNEIELEVGKHNRTASVIFDKKINLHIC